MSDGPEKLVLAPGWLDANIAAAKVTEYERGRAAGLAYAVKLLTAIKDPEPDKDDSWNMGFEVAVDQAIRALSTSPNHVLVPREPTEKVIAAVDRAMQVEISKQLITGDGEAIDVARAAYRAMIAEVK